MQVCISFQTDNHASTPPLSFFYRGRMPFLSPNQQRQSTEGICLTFVQRYLPASTTSVRAAACAQLVESTHCVIDNRVSISDHSCLCQLRRPWRGLMRRLYVAATCSVAQRFEAVLYRIVSYRIAIFCVVSYRIMSIVFSCSHIMPSL